MRKTLKKLTVFSLAGAMMLAPMSAMAEDTTNLEGSGSLEGYVDKTVFSVELPTISDDTIFNFTLDPQKLLAATGGAGGESEKANYKDTTVYFPQKGGKFDSTSQTLKAINTGTNAVKVSLTATASDLGNLKLSESDTITGTDTTIYLGLKQTGATDADAKATITEAAPASLTGTLAGVDESKFETKYDASAAGKYKFTLKTDTDKSTLPAVEFGLEGAANTDSTVDWSKVGTDVAPKVDVKWTLTDATLPVDAAPSVTNTATFTKGTTLSIPVDLGKGNIAATKVKSLTAATTQTGSYATVSSITYASGNISIDGTTWNKASAGDKRYLKVVFDDSNSTTVCIEVTIATA